MQISISHVQVSGREAVGSDRRWQGQLSRRSQTHAGGVQAKVSLLCQEHRRHGPVVRGLLLLTGRQRQTVLQMWEVQVIRLDPRFFRN